MRTLCHAKHVYANMYRATRANSRGSVSKLTPTDSGAALKGLIIMATIQKLAKSIKRDKLVYIFV